MTSDNSDGEARTVEDLSRQLLEAAYPDKDPAWIDEQVELARQRISQAGQPGAQAIPDLEPPSNTIINRAAPSDGRWRRIFFRALTITAGLGVVAAAIVLPNWFAGAAISDVGLYGLPVAAGLAGIGWYVNSLRSRRRPILSCRVRIDTPFGYDVGDVISLQGSHAAVRDAGMVVVRVANTGGSPIEMDDYVSPLMLLFPGREVVSVDVTESEPKKLEDIIPKLAEFSIGPSQITLPRIELQPGNSFKLVVILSGTKPDHAYEVTTEGHLREGSITTERTNRRTNFDTALWRGLTVALSGAFVVVLLLNIVSPFARHPEGLSCVPGNLTVVGSSAFGRAATELAGSYGAYCPDSTIGIHTPGSVEGLRQLHSADWDRRVDLALSDGMADRRESAGLVSRALAIVPFTFVVNDKAPVATISSYQAQSIFTGKARVWSDITGNPADTAEIRVIGRSDSSGTRRTMEHQVIGTPDFPVRQAVPSSDTCEDRRPGTPADQTIVCERASTSDLVNTVSEVDSSIGYADVPDVEQTTGVRPVSLNGHAATLADIRAGYPFWTVEYVYSQGPIQAGSLAAAFTGYMASAEGSEKMRDFKYYACDPAVADLCTGSR